jgi:nicotinamidase-related amidase
MKNPLKSVALLVVDMQEVFLKTIPDSAALLSRCRFAVEAAQLIGIRTYFTTQVPDKLGAVVPELMELTEEAMVFPKTAFSALGASALNHELRNADVDHLIVAGVETSICVYQTALEAINDDLSVTLLSDCIGGRRGEDGKFVLQALAQIGCHVLPCETVFYSILADAEHPLFRPFTALVKKYSSTPPSNR